MVITFPALISIYGWAYFDGEQTGLVAGPADFLISWVLPAIAVIAFWIIKQATPGKMAISAQIVDATTGQPASPANSSAATLLTTSPSFPCSWASFGSPSTGGSKGGMTNSPELSSSEG